MAYIKNFMGRNTPLTFLRLNSFTSVRIPTKLRSKKKSEIKIEPCDNTDTDRQVQGSKKREFFSFFYFMLVLQSVDDI